MAGTKRKGDAPDGNATVQKKKRTTAPAATAAAERPRRSGRSSAPAAKQEADEPKAPKVATKKGSAKTKTKAESPAAGSSAKIKASSTSAQSASAKTTAAKNATTPAKAKATPAKKATAAPDERVAGEKCYWLMKAEPESRIEKGIDVKFSIGDLEACTKPEPWDGVRNPVAQKNMRAMRAGDLAFFYHSNCKVPGIAGAMRIVHEHSVDESAFDPKHPYYDPKSSRDEPRWMVVHVAHVRTFDRFVPLKELQAHAKDGGALAGLQVLRLARLSVSKVEAPEWEFIVRKLVGMQPEEIEGKQTRS